MITKMKEAQISKAAGYWEHRMSLRSFMDFARLQAGILEPIASLLYDDETALFNSP